MRSRARRNFQRLPEWCESRSGEAPLRSRKGSRRCGSCRATRADNRVQFGSDQVADLRAARRCAPDDQAGRAIAQTKFSAASIARRVVARSKGSPPSRARPAARCAASVPRSSEQAECRLQATSLGYNREYPRDGAGLPRLHRPGWRAVSSSPRAAGGRAPGSSHSHSLGQRRAGRARDASRFGLAARTDKSRR